MIVLVAVIEGIDFVRAVKERCPSLSCVESLSKTLVQRADARYFVIARKNKGETTLNSNDRELPRFYINFFNEILSKSIRKSLC